jgi:hypothetical protein
MTNLKYLTTIQLREIIAIKEQIEKLQSRLESIVAGGGGEIPVPATVEAPVAGKRKYHMTAAHKRKLIKALARARKIRWAKAKAANSAKKKDRRSSPATRAKLAAAARARWAKARLEGKTRL